jgi:hypothetical protein
MSVMMPETRDEQAFFKRPSAAVVAELAFEEPALEAVSPTPRARQAGKTSRNRKRYGRNFPMFSPWDPARIAV